MPVSRRRSRASPRCANCSRPTSSAPWPSRRRFYRSSSSLGSLRLASDPTSRIADWNALFGYSASKTALNAFTVRLAHELRSKNIKVNSACPGYVATDLNGHQGLRTVEQGAAIIVNLATIRESGPTGGFFDDAGEVAW